MAFGWECCLKGYKTYFLRASELSQKLQDARKHCREGAFINGLVKPSSLIIDEIGRCVFDDAAVFQSYVNCQGASFASVMLYAVPEYDQEQCQWGPRPVSGGGPQNDHNSLLGSDPLRLSDSG